jgi:hypothetical protein
MYSRPSKDSHEETIWYEIEMLDFCYKRLKEYENRWKNNCDFYVCLEVYLLHFRNLLACFSGKHHRKPRTGSCSFDVDFSNLSVWTARRLEQAQIDGVRNPARLLDDEYYEDISQFLSHVTTRRSAEEMRWKVEEMNKKIRPVVEEFLKLFPPTRQFCGSEYVVSSSLDGASTETRTTPAGADLLRSVRRRRD